MRYLISKYSQGLHYDENQEDVKPKRQPPRPPRKGSITRNVTIQNYNLQPGSLTVVGRLIVSKSLGANHKVWRRAHCERDWALGKTLRLTCRYPITLKICMKISRFATKTTRNIFFIQISSVIGCWEISVRIVYYI